MLLPPWLMVGAVDGNGIARAPGRALLPIHGNDGTSHPTFVLGIAMLLRGSTIARQRRGILAGVKVLDGSGRMLPDGPLAAIANS